jgi:glutathione S-transferase
MLMIWGRANSANVQKVMWLVGEMGLAYERIDAGGPFGGLDAPSFRAMNPHGRVPVIRDGETVVWESHAILRYLAAKHAPGRFWPLDPAARAAIDQWIDWSQASLQPDFLGGVFWGFYRTPAPLRDKRAVARSVAACATHFQLLDRWLQERAFLCGDDLTLADIPAGALLFRYFTLDIERPRVPNVEAWYARLQDRPAYCRHVMVPFDDLFGRLAF